MAEALTSALELAVPLWIDRHRTTPAEERADRAQELAGVVAHKGDIILFPSSRRGETASAFNALAEGLALAAFAPGGVTFDGVRWAA